MRIMRSMARWMMGEYRIYWIYSSSAAGEALPVLSGLIFKPIKSCEEILNSSHADIQDLLEYWGTDAVGYGAWLGADLVAACWFWHGNRYKKRNFWPLGAYESKLVQITTARSFRRKGIASFLIRYSTAEMLKNGFEVLYARIWHSHRASIATFRKAGWKCTALVVEVWPLNSKKRVRCVLMRPSILLQRLWERYLKSRVSNLRYIIERMRRYA